MNFQPVRYLASHFLLEIAEVRVIFGIDGLSGRISRHQYYILEMIKDQI